MEHGPGGLHLQKSSPIVQDHQDQEDHEKRSHSVHFEEESQCGSFGNFYTANATPRAGRCYSKIPLCISVLRIFAACLPSSFLPTCFGSIVRNTANIRQTESAQLYLVIAEPEVPASSPEELAPLSGGGRRDTQIAFGGRGRSSHYQQALLLLCCVTTTETEFDFFLTLRRRSHLSSW